MQATRKVIRLIGIAIFLIAFFLPAVNLQSHKAAQAPDLSWVGFALLFPSCLPPFFYIPPILVE
jgi:hypothetical protein